MSAIYSRFDIYLNRALTVVTAVFLLAAAPLGAQATVEEEVMAITQQGCDAARERDIETLRRLLAPEFTLVGSNAVVQSRDEFLAEIASGDPEYDVFRNHDMTAHVYDDAAIVQGITSLAGRAGGEPFELDVRFTDTLIKIDGQWKLVVSHVTRIPDAPRDS